MKKIVIILGMHRSGTSVITQICQYMGAYLGKEKELMEATQYNLSGFFENKEITYIDDEILRICGQEWYSLEPLMIDFNNPEITERMEYLESILSKMFEMSDMIGVKDPRMALLLPFWEKIFNKLADEVIYVWEFRNPLEVAESLKRRDGFTKKHSLLLWMNYNLSILNFLKEKKYLLINYREILKNSQVFYELAQTLDRKMDDNLIKEINQLVKSEYCHSDFSNQVMEDKCGKEVSDLYNALLNKMIKMEDINNWNRQYMKEIIKIEERYVDNKIQNDIKYLNNKKIIIYGAGKYGHETAKILQQFGINKFDFCDRDINKHGMNIFGGKVYSITEIENKENLVIIIAVGNENLVKEIEQTLVYVKQAELVSFNALKNKAWELINEGKINQKIIFWGTGNIARTFIERHGLFLKSVEIVGFTDNDKNKWGSSFIKYKVSCPSELLKQPYDYIVILSSHYKEIKKFLLENYEIPSLKIISIDEAYQMYVKNIHGIGNGYQFSPVSKIVGYTFSNRMNEKMLEGIDNMFAYLYVKDKYADLLENFKLDLSNKATQMVMKTSKKDTPIWVCWLQGLENAPDIVKCCVNSIFANVQGNIQVITYDNYFKYVKINENILEKHKLGLISKTHFSDIIRLALLCEYGGIWIDSTILMMNRGLPDYIYQLPIFMYKVRETIDAGYYDPRLFTNWFIKSEKEHPVIKIVYKMLEEWWRTEKITPYCIFHYIMRVAWDIYTDYINIEDGDFRYQDKLVLYDNNCRILERLLNEEFDEMLWNILKEEQPLQKLSYKMDIKKGETFYKFILKEYGDGITKIKNNRS